MAALPLRAGLSSLVRPSLLVACCLALAAMACAARAQALPQAQAAAAASPATFDASHLQAPAPLYALWAVKAGDNPAWASPAYDDAQWMRLAPDAVPLSNYIHGRPTVLWYRLRVKVSPNQTGLALQVWNLGNAWEVYLNGRPFLRNGSVEPFSPRTPDARLIRPIPAADIASGSLLIAFRIHISRGDWSSVDPALYISNSGNDPTENLSIGQLTALRDHAWLAGLGENALNWINIWAGLGLGIVALALFLSQRSQREYLWIFLYSLCGAIQLPINFLRLFHTLNPDWVAALAPLQAAGAVFLVLMFFAFLRQPLSPWIKILLVVGAVARAVAAGTMAYQQVPPIGELLGEFPLLFLLCGIIPFRLALGWRRGSREAGILLIPALLFSLSTYLSVVYGFLSRIPALSVFVYHATLLVFLNHIGPFQFSLNSVASSLFMLSLAIIMVVRATRTSRQQALMESEMAAAREVQQVILPQQRVAFHGFEIESEYRPAREVGGDFFQIMPDEKDGSLLIVAGDVTGKGLKAGMLVALLVGAIRQAAESQRDPTAILSALNRRLLGRGDDRATCLALHITRDGAATLANAGHLPPYLNGRPLEIEGSLPLGIVEAFNPSTLSFQLAAKDRLLLLSDGVAEATDSTGQLFGFERVQELVRDRPTAAVIAEAAQAFGQEDDISVIAVTKMSAQPALA